MRPAAAPDPGAVQRNTIRTLVASQAVGALGITIGIATASLLAKDLSGSEELAGTAQTAQVLGAAGASWLLAGVMNRRGRRLGLVAGYLIGAVGSGLAVLAGVIESMPLLLLGAVLLGAISSANYASRYAATDLAGEENRGRSLSVVVWATTIGAVLGPNLSGPAGDLAARLDLPELTGPFALGGISMLVAATIVWVRLRPDPLLVALALEVVEEEQTARAPRIGSVLREHPAIVAAVVGLAAAHAVMISVMVMTPLHMEHGGAGLEIIGIVISVHVLGMFAFAPLVGIAADRFGRAQVLAAGGVVLLVALLLCALSPEGNSHEIFGGLFLLGVGWSMATVSASTIVAEQAPLAARTTVQGTADLVMNLAAAAGSVFSGVIVGEFGFAFLSAFAALFAGVVLLAAGYSGRLARDLVRS